MSAPRRRGARGWAPSQPEINVQIDAARRAQSQALFAAVARLGRAIRSRVGSARSAAERGEDVAPVADHLDLRRGKDGATGLGAAR